MKNSNANEIIAGKIERARRILEDARSLANENDIPFRFAEIFESQNYTNDSNDTYIESEPYYDSGCSEDYWQSSGTAC